MVSRGVREAGAVGKWGGGFVRDPRIIQIPRLPQTKRLGVKPKGQTIRECRGFELE